MSADEQWMRRAVALGRRGEGGTRPNPPVGALVVRSARVVGRGWHRCAGREHAEILALRAAGGRAAGATLYVSLEPCCTHGRTPPCTEAILAAGIRRVVVGVRDPNPRHRGRGLRLLRQAGVDVACGVCGREARALIEPFSVWTARARPFVTLKLGMSLDGQLADVRGRSRWLTSAASRAEVMSLRRRVDAIVVGAGTARDDDPRLTYRGRGGCAAALYRVIVTAGGRLPAGLRVFRETPGQTIVATTRTCPPRRRERFAAAGCAVWILDSRSGGVSPRHLLRRMGQAGFLHVLCEGGGGLARALAQENLVDRYLFYMAPRLLGDGGTGALRGGGWTLERAPRLKVVDVRRVGGDVCIAAVPVAASGG